MRNQVTFTCPYCGFSDEADISLPFIRTGIGGGGTEYTKDGGEVEIETAANAECTECGETFLYKLTHKVVALVAKRPIYTEAE